MLHAIDNKVMRWCIRASRWFQRKTGKSPYAIARIGLVLCLIGALLSLLDYFRQGTLVWETTGFSAFLDGISIFSMALISIYMAQEDEDPKEYEVRATGNLIGGVPPAIRVFTLLFLFYAVPHGFLCEKHSGGPLLLKLLDHGWMVGVSIILYFAPIHPLPKEFSSAPDP